MRVTIVGPGNMGRGIATRLLAGGHAVTLVGRNEAQAVEVVAELDAPDGALTASGRPERAMLPRDRHPGAARHRIHVRLEARAAR